MGTPYHAVSVRLREASACDAVRALADERFLPNEAPSLPVEGCDAAVCKCTYRHHADRRDAPRRDADVGLPGRAPMHGEQRSNAGRREADGHEADAVA